MCVVRTPPSSSQSCSQTGELRSIGCLLAPVSYTIWRSCFPSHSLRRPSFDVHEDLEFCLVHLALELGSAQWPGCRLDYRRTRVWFPTGSEIFLSYTTSRLALSSAQCIEWDRGGGGPLSPGGRGRGGEVNHFPCLGPGLKIMWFFSLIERGGGGGGAARLRGGGGGGGGTRFLRRKRPGREVHPLPRYGAEFKIYVDSCIHYSPSTSLWCIALLSTGTTSA